MSMMKNEWKLAGGFLAAICIGFGMTSVSGGAEYPLWKPGVPQPASLEDIPPVPFGLYSTVQRAERGQLQFLHEAGLGFHGGELFAGWVHGARDEAAPDGVINSRRSLDGGRTWKELETIAPEIPGEERWEYCSFLSHGGNLWAFTTRCSDVWSFRDPKLEAFVLDGGGGGWTRLGVVVEDFVATDKVRPLGNGNFIFAGMYVRDISENDMDARVAISDGDDLTSWRLVTIPHEAGLRWPLVSLMIEGPEIMAVMRNSRDTVALVTRSFDYGETWTEAVRSNFPMIAMKPFAGVLSTGQRYVVSGWPPSEGDNARRALVIAVGSPGSEQLSRVWRVSRGEPLPVRFPGRAKSPQWSYPKAVEHGGNLYVIYSVNKEDAELAVIPVSTFAEEQEGLFGTYGIWRNIEGGSFLEPANWEGGLPGAGRDAVFQISSERLVSVRLDADHENFRALVREGTVELDLQNGLYRLRDRLGVESGRDQVGQLILRDGVVNVGANAEVEGLLGLASVEFETGAGLFVSGSEEKPAEFSVLDGSRVLVGNRFDIGREGRGKLEIRGNGSELTVYGTRPRIGRDAPGTALVWEGGSLKVDEDLRVGWNGAEGDVSRLTVDAGVLEVGGMLSGPDGESVLAELDFRNGAMVNASRLQLGSRGRAELTVSGEGTEVNVSGAVRVGHGGAAVASISDAGLLRSGGEVLISSNGLLRIDGGRLEAEALEVSGGGVLEMVLRDAAGTASVGQVKLQPGAQFGVTIGEDFRPVAGEVIPFLRHGGHLSGTFDNAADGDRVEVNGRTFNIDYNHRGGWIALIGTP